jgi:dihydrodipicolinate synthase/N-acetylneuraminate lyase
MTRTIAEALMEEGEARGWAEGWAEGRLLAGRSILRDLLEQRFSRLSRSLLETIDSHTDLDLLQQAVLRVADIERPEDIFPILGSPVSSAQPHPRQASMKTHFISALCTPQTEQEALHRDGLHAHLDDQWRHGIDGLLVAGSMGMMQLLTDTTYRDLVSKAVSFTRGRGEVLVGVGDTSFARTLARIRAVEEFAIDGGVVLTPYFFPFRQDELLDYYTALADQSRKPLFLYDLPQLTGSKVELATVLRLAEHPNILGIKCSDRFDWTRQLLDLAPAGFRVIVAQPFLVDTLLRAGVREHLDGIYAVAPHWVEGIRRAADAGDWEAAGQKQRDLSALLRALRDRYPLFPAVAALLGARGIPGNVAPRPFRPLTGEERERLLAEPIVKQLLADGRA